MKKLFTFCVSFLLTTFLSAQYQFLESSFGNEMMQRYPSCVTNPQSQVYILDTICSATIQDTLYVYSYIGHTDLFYFKNLKKLSINPNVTYFGTAPFQLPSGLIDLEVCLGTIAGTPALSVELPPNLEKLAISGTNPQGGFYYNSLPNTLRKFTYFASLTDEPYCYITNIPDSLRAFSFYNQDNGADTITILPSFENAVHFENFYYEKDINGPGLRLAQFPVFPSGVEKILALGIDIDSIYGLPEALTDLTCMSLNNLNYLDEFPPNLKKLSLYGNFSCLPEYPQSLEKISSLYSPNFTCHPNYVPGLIVGGSVLQENRLCSDPVLNENDCPASNSIVGYVYHDALADCQYNANGDLELYNIPLVLLDENDNFIKKVYSESNGFYAFSVEDGTYKVKLDTSETNLRKTCVGQEYEYTFTSSDLNPNVLQNFQLQCDTLIYNYIDSFDLKINAILNFGANFPGMPGAICISSKDLIYNPQLNCSSGVEGYLDSNANFQVRITGPVTFMDTSVLFTHTYSGDTLIVNYNDSLIQYYGNRNFCFGVQTDTTAQLGDIICVEAEIFPPAGDVNLSNNVLSRCYEVMNSYDPNMKETWPFQVKPGFDDEIRYTIHFQNTGNAPAINIQLVDTLDEKLDLSTFRVVEASHNVTPILDGNKLRFKFTNINLADSLSNPEGSKGYVEYAIRPKNPMQLDEKIYNTAYIYFDFNEPIVTNTSENWCTTFELNVAEETQPENKLLVYPNPLGTERLLKIKKSGNEEMKVSLFDLNGTEVGKYTLTSYQNEINLKELKAGIYILKSESVLGIYSGKLVVF